jgi:DNA-binding NtrC family response regulator
LIGQFLIKHNEARRELGRPTLEVSPEAMAALLERPFSGNIRELKNLVERAASLGDGPVLTRRDFMLGGGPVLPPAAVPAPPVVAAPLAPVDAAVSPATPAPAPARDRDDQVVFDVDIGVPFKDAKDALTDRFEAIYLRLLVAANKGNISQCAKVAGLTRFHLRELLKKHEIKAKE